jgi:hypothetical protein
MESGGPAAVSYAYLSVESDNIRPDDITTTLGRVPDSTRERGSPRRTGRGVYDCHKWRLDLAVPGRDHFGTEELSTAIVGLGADVAAGCRSLRHQGADITLQIVQEVRGDDDTQARGLHLTHDAIAWLLAAGAELDIDQYFFAD